MYATKRKFHSLLSSLSANGSSTNLASQGAVKEGSIVATEVESQPKKRRVLEPYAALLAPERRARPKNTSLSPPRTSAKDRTASGTSLPAAVPNFSPWDRGQFLERLKTFRHVDKWSSKPAEITEVQWARRGWTCVGKERVGCVGGCGKEVCIKLEEEADLSDADDDETEDCAWVRGAEEQLVERYSGMIVTEHHEDCLWRQRGCNEDIYRLSLQQPQTAIAALRSRYRSILSMGSEMPSSLRYPVGSDVDGIIRTLPPDFGHSEPSTAAAGDEDSSSSSRPIDKNAFVLALVGWQAESGHVSGLLTCNICFRRLGLWLFTKRPRTSTRESTSDSDDDGEEPLVTALDAVSEHRDYCPWINAKAQSGHLDAVDTALRPEDKAGWQTLVRVLGTDHHFRMRATSARPELAARSKSSSTNVPGPDGQAGEGGVAVADEPPAEEDLAARDRKDKERWAKLKKLKKVFDVKSRKIKRVKA